MHLPLAYYIFSSALNFICSLGLCIFVYPRRVASPSIKRFFNFCLSATLWSLSYTLWLIAGPGPWADFLMRTACSATFLLPAAYLHFVLEFLGLADKKKHLMTASYSLCGVLFALTYTHWYLDHGGPVLNFAYWLHAGPVFHIAMLYYFGVIVYTHCLWYQAIQVSHGIRKRQIQFIFWGTLVGYFGGTTNFFLIYGIPIPPFLNILVIWYAISIGYAIFKTRLMDLRLALRRWVHFLGLLGIFMVPFLILLHWQAPTWLLLADLLIILLSYPHASQYLSQITDQLFAGQLAYFTKIENLCNTVLSILDYAELEQVLCKTLRAALGLNVVFIYRSAAGMPPSDSIELSLKIEVEGPEIVMLALGTKLNNEVYSEDDVRLLNRLCRACSLAMKNIALHETLLQNDRQLQASHKMASLGNLVNGIYQELQQPLSNMSQLPVVLKTFSKQPDTVRQAAQALDEDLKRCKQILAHTLNFAKPHAPKKTATPLHQLLAQCLHMLEHPLQKNRVNVVTELSAYPDRVDIDPSQMQQACMNILVNAIEAAPRGTITVSSSNTARGGLCLKIKDNGSGIRTEDLGRIWDPFFTTKGSTGLGLAIARQLLEENGATVSVESELGRGTVVILIWESSGNLPFKVNS